MGLTPARTGRFISACFTILGTVFLTISIVVNHLLTGLLPLAQGMVKDGLALYDSFTGRLAVSNISGHKELLEQLKVAKGMMPSEGLLSFAHVCVPLLITLAVILLGLAIFGFVKPVLLCSCLTRIKLLKWGGEASVPGTPSAFLLKLKSVPLKVYAIAGGVFAGIVLVAVVIAVACGPSKKIPAKKIMDLEKRATDYVVAQKTYFNRSKTVGDASALGLDSPMQSDFFDYNVSSSKFTAELRKEVGGCPAGSRWTISAKAEGFFTKELKLYRKAPADTNCVKLVPDFKNVGRKQNQK